MIDQLLKVSCTIIITAITCGTLKYRVNSGSSANGTCSEIRNDFLILGEDGETICGNLHLEIHATVLSFELLLQ